MHLKHIITALAVSVFSLSGAEEANAQFGYTPTEVRPLFKRDTVTLCIMGDMMMHTAQIENAHRGGGTYSFDTYFMHLKDRIKAADIAIANMEYTLAGQPFTGYPAFSAPDSYATYLAECGFDIFLCANNHIFDKGSKGAARTLKQFKQLNVRHCGLAADEKELAETMPLIILRKGMHIAIVNFTYGVNLGADAHWPKVNFMGSKEKIADALGKAADTDLSLVLPHWGTEYSLLHSDKQREMASWLVDKGADMVIGAHPHVVQDCETISNVQVAYSLGNAVSNMSAENTQIELMATVKVVREENGDTKVLPIGFTWLWCSRPGGYCNSYTVLPVEEFIGRKDEWKGSWDYEKMMRTYEKVRSITGIKTE
jgi:poly-gamma-glutamate synthesis protein (capsule biosynthesis protein)